jgi:hypothetical protein
MQVLIACEFSGRVREAFRARGHDAWSNDLLPASDHSPWHIKGDTLRIDPRPWDLVIAHPPCTHLCSSGARWFKQKVKEQRAALHFITNLWNHFACPMAIENPIGVLSTRWLKPTQIIQPWQFGHGETKATCLWLRDLPRLSPTDEVAAREPICHRMPPSKDRWAKRSITYQGIADAMAEQWANHMNERNTDVHPKKS